MPVARDNTVEKMVVFFERGKNMFTDKTKIREILADEDFAEFQEFLFPEMFVKNKLMRMLPLKAFDKVWSVESMVSGFQHMKNLWQRGEKLFYPIYDEKEAQKDPSLKQRVLFHFPVEGKTPFVVICAGGGYESVCSFVEAFPVAEAFNKKGYHAFVVNYRTGEKAHFPNPMEDLANAVSYILAHADEFQVETEGYAVTGFSAGGHLAASFGTESLGYKKYDLPKPGTMLLAYPVITMGKHAHKGSRLRILGKGNVADQQLRDLYSIEKQVTEHYPPAYIWQCEADNTVPIQNSAMMVEELKKRGIPCQYHVYPGNAHGWGLATGKAAEGWLDEAVAFWEENLSVKNVGEKQ